MATVTEEVAPVVTVSEEPAPEAAKEVVEKPEEGKKPDEEGDERKKADPAAEKEKKARSAFFLSSPVGKTALWSLLLLRVNARPPPTSPGFFGFNLCSQP
uniref:Uncharacterized protein n=1 Tax=Zea mays TaxID=4577 RepID=B6T643_MAIZE|nr:hypothetical protein [Zea mays]